MSCTEGILVLFDDAVDERSQRFYSIITSFLGMSRKCILNFVILVNHYLVYS